MDTEKIIKDLASLKVAVIGDVMLDTYCWGKVDRISPEAPVPVVVLGKKEYRVGGAANVALNTVAMGAATYIFSVIGDDDDGQRLKQLLNEANIHTEHMVLDTDRFTTNKTRIISRNQQMLRMDAEVTTDISHETEEKLLQQLQQFIKAASPQVVILEDYNKGVLTTRVITETIRICNEAGICTAVDPKRKNFFAYKGCTIFKPNLKEVKEALNLLNDAVNAEALNNIHLQLFAELNNKYSLITLSENGIFYQGAEESAIIPTHKRNIADVSGAGDTVIAVASLLYAATNKIELAAQVSNIAGGLVCEEVGTVAIDKNKLVAECKNLLG